jgi:outer membrane protein
MRVVLCIFLLFLPTLSFAEEISLVDFLKIVWENGPVRHGEALQDSASEDLVRSAKGKYLPHVSLDAIDTTGFPASNSELQVDGLMGSPFRSGLAGGVVVEQTLYDFGRIQSAVARARVDKSTRRAQLAADKFQFLTSVGQIYLACAQVRSMRHNDEDLMRWAQINLKETARFTKTGQRSIVDNALVQTEVNTLNLELDQLQKYEQSLNAQMQIYGVKADCRRLSGSLQTQVPSELKVQEPSVLVAEAEIEVAQASYEAARSAQLPKLNAMGSFGDMDRARLVDKQNYAAGVGLEFPIWNGGEDAKREHAYKTQADYQRENLKAAQLEYSKQIKNLQDGFDRNQEALGVIDKNREQVEKTLRLATKRYQTLQGPLIDFREAFKQLREVNYQRIRTMQTLAAASLQLSLLNSK